MPSTEETSTRSRIAVIIVARGAIAAAPRLEMERLAAHAAAVPEVTYATHAFTEQGLPPLREVLANILGRGFDEIRLVPALLPMEPSFRTWIGRTIARWQAEAEGPWPTIRIGPGPETSAITSALVADLVAAAADMPVLEQPVAQPAAGSIVPAARRRVLVCQGGPCNEAGAAVIWGHLRNEQERLGLRTAGQGTMSARTSCLGPCNLAPVVQVWPEGTVYGGIREAGIDRIIADHLLGDEPVADLAYWPTGRKQTLRSPR